MADRWAVLLLHNFMFLCVHHLKEPDSDLCAFLRSHEYKGAGKPSKLPPDDDQEKGQKNVASTRTHRSNFQIGQTCWYLA